VFLCGGRETSRRDNLRDYLIKYHPEVSIFYAEAVWAEIVRAKSTSNALEVEEYLASLADLVVIIVESPGTFAELGAFSLSTSLRQKLLPIVDSAYEFSDESFIKTGPIRWVDRDSLFRPTVYVNLSKILEAASVIDDRLSRLPKSKSERIRDLGINRKYLVFFMSDLVAVVAPATISLLHYYLGHILGSNITEDEVATLVGVAVAMKLLVPVLVTVQGLSTTYYLGHRTESLSKPFHHRRVDLPTLRASHMSVLQTIREARSVIEATQARMSI